MPSEVRLVPCAARWRPFRAAGIRRGAMTLAALMLALVLSATPLPAGFPDSATTTLANPSAQKPTTTQQSRSEAIAERLVENALQYVGTPYVYAGAGPGGFDCSGFTWYIVSETMGLDIGRGVWTQWEAGTQVDYADLQPGDLVFFANTWGPGLTHVGIYIGNGQFVHAENESTGVVVSTIADGYYDAHYAGAVRLT